MFVIYWTTQQEQFSRNRLQEKGKALGRFEEYWHIFRFAQGWISINSRFIFQEPTSNLPMPQPNCAIYTVFVQNNNKFLNEANFPIYPIFSIYAWNLLQAREASRTPATLSTFHYKKLWQSQAKERNSALFDLWKPWRFAQHYPYFIATIPLCYNCPHVKVRHTHTHIHPNCLRPTRISWRLWFLH